MAKQRPSINKDFTLSNKENIDEEIVRRRVNNSLQKESWVKCSVIKWPKLLHTGLADALILLRYPWESDEARVQPSDRWDWAELKEKISQYGTCIKWEFQVVNYHLLKDLTERDLYKTTWEIPQKVLLDLAADRAPFIDQSQSLNVFLSEPSVAKISSMHFYAWKKGLKTGMYYLRTRPAVDAIKFTVDQASLAKKAEKTFIIILNYK
ncbi:unnamed protein product [Rhizophagus irregularis]|uniref:Ribonucleotide reductase large subunit C-terminal domain-containing protein n=1 Tax=Rhizophagus irregularis TaxID=588596 RepID=A0A915ZJR0_9GLOM|nr:unnamed protein product [Rhizophagus irregularis]CAB5379919.1 unnamed protein product [Rhizophagus irregularis]